MSDRQLILQAVEEMPAEASFAEILDELLLLGTVKQRLAEVDRGDGVPHEQVAKLIEQWIAKSSGPHPAVTLERTEHTGFRQDCSP